MPTSPLRGFNRCSVDELVDLGVHIVYDHSLIISPWLGLWYPAYDLICINPEAKEEKPRVVVHEGLHAYEDLILDVEKRFKESQIDWWAWNHLKKDPGLADYMLKGLLVPHQASLKDKPSSRLSRKSRPPGLKARRELLLRTY